MPAISGSSFTSTTIPELDEHPVILDFDLVDEIEPTLNVSQSVKISVSGSEDTFMGGFVKEYDSGSLFLQVETFRNEGTGSFDNWIVRKTMGGASRYTSPLERNEDLLRLTQPGANIEAAITSGDLPSAGSFADLLTAVANLAPRPIVRSNMADGFLKCFKQVSELPVGFPIEASCFLKGACMATVVHEFAQAHLSTGDSTLPNLKIPPGAPVIPPSATTAPMPVIPGTEKGTHYGKPLFIKPAIQVLLGLAFVITYRKSLRAGFTAEQAREVQSTEFAKALKNYFKTTLIVGVSNHNGAKFNPGTAFAGTYIGTTTAPGTVIPLTGFSIGVGKISNPELNDEPLSNFIEAYKEMMLEQERTPANTPIEVAQLKMAKRLASAMMELFDSIEIEGNHFAPLMLSMPGITTFGNVITPAVPVPTPGAVVAPMPPIPGTNKGKFGVAVGEGKLIP